MIIQGIDVASLMTYLINEVACTMEYEWGAEFNHQDLSEYYARVQEKMAKIDYTVLTDEELTFLGFRKYKEEDQGYLIPLWLLRVLPKGTIVRGIHGEIKKIGVDDIDNDVRGGCVAYALVRDEEAIKKEIDVCQYEERSSDYAEHVWVDKIEKEPYATYSRPIGMIKPVFEGYLAVGQYQERTFESFEQAKQFIIQQEEEDKH